jgi:hypothetical protein
MAPTTATAVLTISGTLSSVVRKKARGYAAGDAEVG